MIIASVSLERFDRIIFHENNFYSRNIRIRIRDSNTIRFSAFLYIFIVLIFYLFF